MTQDKTQIDLAIEFVKTIKYMDPVIAVGLNTSGPHVQLDDKEFVKLFPVSKSRDSGDYTRHSVEVDGIEIIALSSNNDLEAF